MKEYVINYTVNGKGFSQELPWIFDLVYNAQEARQAYQDAVDYLQQYNQADVWVEARQVGSWERLDPDPMTW
jgi:hypothetical protein